MVATLSKLDGDNLTRHLDTCWKSASVGILWCDRNVPRHLNLVLVHLFSSFFTPSVPVLSCTMQSHRSPRQQISRSRAKPYARRPPPVRSASIMSTIKNIVTAPLSWFAANEEFEDTPGKRRRALPRDGLQQESRTVKRQRHRSPSPLPNQGYLDPPQLLLQSPAKPDSRSQGQNQPTAFSPSVSINIPSNPQQQHLGRHAYLPISTTYSQHNLPPQLTREATTVPLPHSREHSIASLSRDHSIGPTRTSFRMRTTLSPVPSGNEFGPKPQRRERDPSEPPPLTALMSNPIFVKPPPDVHPIQRSLSAQPTITLGSLAQAHRPVGHCGFSSSFELNRDHRLDLPCAIQVVFYLDLKYLHPVVIVSTCSLSHHPIKPYYSFQFLLAQSTQARLPYLNLLYTELLFYPLGSVDPPRFRICSSRKKYTRSFRCARAKMNCHAWERERRQRRTRAESRIRARVG